MANTEISSLSTTTGKRNIEVLFDNIESQSTFKARKDRSSQVENNSPPEISVRRARPEDAQQMHNVHVTSVRMLCSGDYTIEQIEAWVGRLDPEKRRQRMARNLEASQAGQSEQEILFVAEDKLGAIVGLSSLGKDEVNAVYVHPHYIRLRVGSLLLNAVEMEAIAQNMKKLRIDASITAVPFIRHEATKLLNTHFIP